MFSVSFLYQIRTSYNFECLHSFILWIQIFNSRPMLVSQIAAAVTATTETKTNILFHRAKSMPLIVQKPHPSTRGKLNLLNMN